MPFRGGRPQVSRQLLLANCAGFGCLVTWSLVTGILLAVLTPTSPVGRLPWPLSFQPAPHRQPRPADERSVARRRLADQHQLPCVHRGGVCHAPKPSSVTAVDIHVSPSTPCGSDFRPTGVLCGGRAPECACLRCPRARRGWLPGQTGSMPAVRLRRSPAPSGQLASP